MNVYDLQFLRLSWKALENKLSQGDLEPFCLSIHLYLGSWIATYITKTTINFQEQSIKVEEFKLIYKFIRIFKNYKLLSILIEKMKTMNIYVHPKLKYILELTFRGSNMHPHKFQSCNLY